MAPDEDETRIADKLQHWLNLQEGIITSLTESTALVGNSVYKPLPILPADIPLIPPPYIPTNDPDLCCLYSRIQIYEKKKGGISGEGILCEESRLSPLGPRGKVGVPYLATFSDPPLQLILKVTEISDTHSQYRSTPPTQLRKIIGKTESLRECLTSGVDLTRMLYVGLDEFANETINAYILNTVFHLYQELVPPLYVKHYWATLCLEKGKTSGLNLMEYCDRGTLREFPRRKEHRSYLEIISLDDLTIQEVVKPWVLFEILKQIVAALHFLETTVLFTSGDLKADNVFVKSDRIDTTYYGIPLDAPFTCKVADFGKSSSTTFRNDDTPVRFYNHNALADAYLRVQPFALNVQTTAEGIYYYVISNLFTTQVYTRSRHMGIPFYLTYDLYTVLVSLLTAPEFYHTFFSNSWFRIHIWKNLWLDAQEEIMQYRIQRLMKKGEGRKISESIDMLKNIKLRCDAIRIVINAIRDNHETFI